MNRKLLEMEVATAWYRRNGDDDPIDRWITGELLEIADCDVYPTYSPNDEDDYTEFWEWRYTPRDKFYVQGSHSEPPPVTDELVEWLNEQ